MTYKDHCSCRYEVTTDDGDDLGLDNKFWLSFFLQRLGDVFSKIVRNMAGEVVHMLFITRFS
jgi:hypothetical protein